MLFAPHLQAPLAQVSAIEVQALHIAPPAPHAWVVGGVTQVLPEQQPEVQLVESHTQLPLEQRWPGAQAAFPPHLQVPPEQLSALVPQALHALPPVPQAPVVGVMLQTPLVQQPEQLLGVQPEQLPLVQLWPPGQLWQVLPPLPHAVGSVPVTQLLPMQQPVGHEAGSHTQAPLEHFCP